MSNQDEFDDNKENLDEKDLSIIATDEEDLDDDNASYSAKDKDDEDAVEDDDDLSADLTSEDENQPYVESVTNEDLPNQSSKKSTGKSVQAPKKNQTSPNTPTKKRGLRSDPIEEKPRHIAKKPRFNDNVDEESRNADEGSSKHAGRLLSPVIISPKKSRSDKTCEVTNIQDANESLRDTYSGLTPLSTVAIATGGSSSEEKMVLLKDWAADGANMKYIVKVIITKRIGDGFVNPSRANPADFVVAHISRTPYLGRRAGGVAECMMVGEVLSSNISTPRSMSGLQEGKEYKLIRIMPIPVEYEQFAAFMGEVFRLKNVVMPLWNGGLEFKTVPSAKPAQSSPTRGVAYKSRLNVASPSTSNRAALNAYDEVPVYDASSGNSPFPSIVNLSNIPQYSDPEVPMTTPVIVCFTVNTYSGQNGMNLSLNLHWVAVLV
ncbi:hypothetical protein JAAARDRAFT_200872 [Jaapia argillacea MUCL 33604]|uniref:Uncharacterized protein n=1 Tax=Jaapia argillacea MUCL 33604 TaxID=933084 RepID=A0A067P3H5_9AGAM|nr:hypothetical protein JAAARDRAFT_200872 [Jaapia argillacea MUCL 33604]